MYRLGEEGEFWVASPLPQIKFELRCIPKGIFSGSKLAKVCIYIHTCMHTYIHTHMHTHATYYICTCIHTYINTTYTHATYYIHTYAYIYIYIHITYTYIHTYI